MSQLTTGLPPGSDFSRSKVVLASILALATGAGWCCAFALGFWVRGLIHADVGRSARAGPESAAIDRPAPAEPGRPAEPRVKTPVVAVPPATPPAEAAPLVAASTKPPPDRPVGPVGDRTPTPAAPERFVLGEAAPRSSLPFVLPEKPSFALADLQLDEPAAGGQAEQVCRGGPLAQYGVNLG